MICIPNLYLLDGTNSYTHVMLQFSYEIIVVEVSLDGLFKNLLLNPEGGPIEGPQIDK